MGRFDSLFENPAFVMGMNLLGTPGPQGFSNAFGAVQGMQKLKQEKEQQAQLIDWHNRSLQEQVQQHAAEQAYQNRMAAVAEGNLGVNRTHADVYSAEAAMKNLTMQRQMDSDKQFNEQFLPQIQSWLGRIGAGGQPVAPTGATQQMLQPRSDPTQMPPAVMGNPGAVGPTAKPSSGFQSADALVRKVEGGFTPNDAGSGPTNFGINQKANPDVDVKSLTPESAAQIRKTRYWDAIQGDNLPPATAMVAYDAAINQGVDYARKLVQSTDGNPTLMLQQRKQDYQELAKQPRFAGQLESWQNRLASLSSQVEGQSNAPAAPQAPTGATGLAMDQQMRVIGAMQLMRDPATRAQGMKELAEAVTPKFAAPGSIDTRTGQALPNPALDETTRHNKVEENFAGNKDVRESAKLGMDVGKYPGELQQQKATIAKTQAELPEIQARTKETEAKAARTTQETAAANTGQEQGILSMNQALDSLTASYDKLDKLGAITDTSKSAVENLKRTFTRQTKGSSLGQAMGSEVAAELNNINMTKPMLMAGIMHSTGLKSTQMNSDKELQFYVSAATDPAAGKQANQQAIARLREYTNWARQHQSETNPSFARYLADSGGSVPTPGSGGTSEKQPMSLDSYRSMKKGQ